jgi:hypothetical protein
MAAGLGTCLVSALLVVDPAVSASSATPGSSDQLALSAAKVSGAQNTYSSVSGPALRRGTLDGTKVSQARVVFGAGSGTRRVAGSTWQAATWTSGWMTPTHTFTQLVPSWQATTPAGTFVQIGVRARTSTGAVSSFDQIAKWSTRDKVIRRTSLGAQTDDTGRVATDTFLARPGTQFTSWQVKVTLLRKPGAASPTLRKVGGVASLMPSSVPATSAPLYGAQQLAVPAYSQMTHRGQYPKYGGGGEAWCSPTSLSMILGYYGRLPSPASYTWVKKSYTDRVVDHVARMTYDYRYQGTGNWPFNTAFAGQYVDDAFVTRLPDLRDAERFIRAGIPLATSISFARGQLSGAPISASNGHLVVISGFTAAGNVIVNDPAAPSNASVVRTYDRAQFERAWLQRSDGTVYVVHDAAHPLPDRAGSTSW